MFVCLQKKGTKRENKKTNQAAANCNKDCSEQKEYSEQEQSNIILKEREKNKNGDAHIEKEVNSSERQKKYV